MKYETKESWHNSQARKMARWLKEQAAHDAAWTAQAAPKWEFPVEKMALSPRLPGEDLISYTNRLNAISFGGERK